MDAELPEIDGCTRCRFRRRWRPTSPSWPRWIRTRPRSTWKRWAHGQRPGAPHPRGLSPARPAGYFTSGETETRAGSSVGARPPGRRRHPQRFRARLHQGRTASFEDYVALGGEKGCRDAGKLRQEGKDYVVQDGDVMHFKFNV
ncbi:MAG: DUF933 domain-containing protein [Coriobacteriaceae bacterium]